MSEVGYNAIQTLAKRFLSDIKMEYLQMPNIDVHKILQGVQGTHVACVVGMKLSRISANIATTIQ